MTDKATCELCGEPMPADEEMFKIHGYSGDCPKPPLPRPAAPDFHTMLMAANQLIRSFSAVCDRKGASTNWDALNAQVKKMLTEQHGVLYPQPIKPRAG